MLWIHRNPAALDALTKPLDGTPRDERAPESNQHLVHIELTPVGTASASAPRREFASTCPMPDYQSTRTQLNGSEDCM